jgi:sporulation protein YlmC with PRC-barrel domain
MLKKHMAMALVGTALIAAPAYAQTGSGSMDTNNDNAASPSTTSPSMDKSPSSSMGSSSSSATDMDKDKSPSASSSSSTSSSSSNMAQAGSTQFLTNEQANQWRSSKLIGLDVYSADNQKIGDVNDVLINREGQAVAAVIGVGGFLGIGEKNVAVPFASLQFSDQPVSGRSATNGTAGGAGGGMTTTTTTASNTNKEAPDHAMLSLSKADLQNAPAFTYANSSSSASGSKASR